MQITDIYDKQLADELHHLENCNTIPAIHSWLESMDTLIQLAGICTLVKKPEDHFEIIKEVCWWYVVGRTTPALESFKERLNTLGVLPAIKCQSKAFQKVLCYQEKKFYATTFDALLKVDRSARGTQKFVNESRVLMHWKDLLGDIEESNASLSFSEILAFTTGSSTDFPK